MLPQIAAAALLFADKALAQNVTFQDHTNTILRVDNGTYGPAIEEVHYCTICTLSHHEQH